MKNYIKEILQQFTTNSYQKEIVDEVHIWLTDNDKAEEKNAALNEIWNETEGKMNYNLRSSLNQVYAKTGVNKKIYKMAWFRYAAVFTLLAVSVITTYLMTINYHYESEVVEHYTKTGESLFLELPDGTKVQTNSKTFLLYPEQFKGETRTVFIIGEADFKVKPNPDQPFIVKTIGMDVTALGTEFNVSSYAEEGCIDVTLLEGKVAVNCGVDHEKYILHPGQQISYNKELGKARLASIDIEDATAWQRGILIFRSATLKEIFNDLNKKFGVEFQYNENHLNKDKYNFRFSSKASLTEILNIMSAIIDDFNYEINGDICLIK